MPPLTFTFTPWIDLPLACLTLGAFVLHFNAWAKRRPAGTNVDLARRLPSARAKVIGLFAGVVLLCWLINFSLWAIFALLLIAGFCLALVAGADNVDSSGAMFVFVGFLIREWCFGFPLIILHPQPAEDNSADLKQMHQELLGKHGVALSPLRPYGEAELVGCCKSVVSETGELIDAGTSVVVSGVKNGSICVRPIE